MNTQLAMAVVDIHFFRADKGFFNLVCLKALFINNCHTTDHSQHYLREKKSKGRSKRLNPNATKFNKEMSNMLKSKPMGAIDL